MSENSAHPILSFWFGEIDDKGEVDSAKKERWWKKSDEFDALCGQEFEKEVVALKAGKREDLRTTTRGALAYILLADQMPRNIYRNTPASFETDVLALRACLALCESGEDMNLLPVERAFAYMPLMHSEDPTIQVMSILKFSKLKETGVDFLGFAIKHKDFIDRFGRYPHRNEILGRKSTPEELAFLSTPGSSF